MMTLEEAIKHCEEKSDCTECGMEHRQLAEWLRELKERRELSIGWIPVEERLPENNKYIRIICKCLDAVARAVQAGEIGFTGGRK